MTMTSPFAYQALVLDRYTAACGFGQGLGTARKRGAGGMVGHGVARLAGGRRTVDLWQRPYVANYQEV